MSSSLFLSKTVILWVFLFVHHVSGQTVVEGFVGGSVILRCNLTSTGDLTWKQGPYTILVKKAGGQANIGTTTPYIGDVSLVENSINLRINRLDRIRDGDTGQGDKIFECIYTGTGGGRQQILLRLLARIKGVSIPEASNGRVTATAGISTRFTCSVTENPNPPPSYSWSVDGGSVSGQTSSQYTFTPNKSIRTIRCTATNKYSNGSVLSEKEATAILNVQYLDTAKSPAPVLKIIENDKATLQCSAEGNPPPSYRWRGPGNQPEIKSTSANYIIENIQRSAAGEYKCSYNNTIGSYVLTANLVVEYPPDVTVSYNKTTQTLTCRAAGVPDDYSFSQWKHRLDGKLLQTLGTGKMGGTTVDLHLPGTLTYKDTGYYVCQVSNKIKSPQRGQVLITPQSPPIFEDQSFTKTMSVPFYTYSDTPDVKVVWKKSGESTVLTSHREETGPVKLMVRGQSVNIEGTVTVLTLKDLTQSDEGNYTVTVTNTINGQPQSNQITVSVSVGKTDQSGEPSSQQAAVIAGGASGAVIIILIVVIIVIVIRRRSDGKQEKKSPKKYEVGENEAFSDDRWKQPDAEIAVNELYGSPSSLSKSHREAQKPAPKLPKPVKHKKKEPKKNGPKVETRGDAELRTETVDDISMLYATVQKDSQAQGPKQGHEKPVKSQKPTGKGKLKPNKKLANGTDIASKDNPVSKNDGLNYSQVDFKKKTGKPKVHLQKSPVTYADINFIQSQKTDSDLN